MRTTAQRAGDGAEARTAAALELAGWIVLGRQLRAGRLELDILAVDPGPPPCLVAVEVRWRSGRGFGLPEETVDHRKLGRVRAAAHALRARGTLPDGTRVPALPIRVDLVALEPGGRSRHHRHAG